MDGLKHFESGLLLDISTFLIRRRFYLCKIDRIYEEFLAFCISNECKYQSSLEKENLKAFLDSRTFDHLILSESLCAFERVYSSIEKIDPVYATEAYLLMRDSGFYENLSNEEIADLIRSAIAKSKNLIVYREESNSLSSNLQVVAEFNYHQLVTDMYLSEIMLRKLGKL